MKEDARRSLESLLGKNVTTDPIELITYEVDAGLNQGSPEGVAFPQSQEDVVRLVQWAAEHQVPLVARGSGTGLSGGAVPAHGGVVVSFSRMNRVLDIDETDRLAVVEPGIINLTLDTIVKERGYYFPPDPASGRAASIGGNIAVNAGGPHCFKYGVTTNYVMGLDLVLADGQVVRTAGRASGYPEYDFTSLMCGSEGTLSIISAATLRLIHKPLGYKTMIATFDSVETAGQAVSAVISGGLVPASLEMLDNILIGIIEDYAHAGLPTDAAAMLLAEVDGYPDGLDLQIEELVQIMKQKGALHLRVFQTPAEREKIWMARKSAFGAMARISPAYFQVDGTVPRARLAETLADINQMCAELGLRVGYVFHAGDGNLHPLIPFDPQDKDMERRVHQAGDGIMAICVSKDGTITGEHGVGIEKSKYMPLMYNADELAAMHEVKEVFDPGEILNPGKIFPAEMQPVEPPPVGKHINRLPSLFTPQSETEAADGLRVAQSLGQPVFIGKPRAGVYLPPDAAVLSVEAFQGIVTLSPDDLYVTARAGMRLADLQRELAAHGLWVLLASPWMESTLGGIVSTAFSSPYRMRYGEVRDQVLGLRVILPDGRRLRYGRPVVKNVAGFDMAKLFVGAHGTLGLITEVILRLSTLPRARRSLIVPVQDLGTGMRLGQSTQRMNLIASSVLLCRGGAVPEIPPSPYQLIFTAEGHPGDVEAELQAASAVVSGTETDSFFGIDIWAAMLRSGTSHLRIGVAPGSLPDFIQDNADALGESYVVDLSSGVMHVMPAPLAQIPRLRQAALDIGGYAVVVDESGDSGIDPWGYNPDTLPLMRSLKARWDPNGCLNPGVFLV